MSFHLPFGVMTVTLDDVSCLLHLLIEGMLLSQESVPRADVVQLMMEMLGVDAGDITPQFII